MQRGRARRTCAEDVLNTVTRTHARHSAVAPLPGLTPPPPQLQVDVVAMATTTERGLFCTVWVWGVSIVLSALQSVMWTGGAHLGLSSCSAALRHPHTAEAAQAPAPFPPESNTRAPRTRWKPALSNRLVSIIHAHADLTDFIR